MKYSFPSVLLVLIILSGIISSCSALVSESGEAVLPVLNFSSELVSPGPVSPPALSAAGSVGKILAQGAINSPDPCHKISGQAELEGKEITLHITSVSMGVLCIGVVATFGFTAKLTVQDAGTYRFRIKHKYAANSETYIVLEQDIQVL